MPNPAATAEDDDNADVTLDDEGAGGGASAEGDAAVEGDEAGAGAAEGESDGDAAAAAAAGEEADAEATEVIVTLGDETPPAGDPEDIEGKPAPQWVKDLRKTARDQAKLLRQQSEELAKLKAGAKTDAVVVGPEPKLADYDYDEEKYNAARDAWKDRKVAAEQQENKRREAEQQAQAAWNKVLDTFKANKSTFATRVPDFEDAEEAVKVALSPVQQAILVKAKRSVELVYAIGKRPELLKKLAGVTDPVDFTYEVGEIMSKLNVTPKKAAPVPEKVPRSNVAGASGVDHQLDQLMKEADRTGDRSKVAKYLRQKQSA